MWQAILVWVLVVAASAYVAWALLPQSLRAKLLPAAGRVSNSKASSTAPCSNCSASSSSPAKRPT
jgi:cytochrome c553